MPRLSLQSVAHCNVNCSDLATSRRFYEDVVGLGVGAHTAAPPQDGSGFGLDGAIAWDAWMMNDHRAHTSPGAPVVDLLQWLAPTPTGAPLASPHHVGLARLLFWAPSIAPLRARLAESDGRILFENEGAIAAHDPDGTQVLFTEKPVDDIEFRGVAINCSDLAISVPWYERILGLTVAGTTTVTASGPRFVSPDEHPRVRVATLAVRDQGQMFELCLERWQQTPGTRPAPQHANHVGLFRLAFMVSDIDESYRVLLGHGVECIGPPVTLDMGPEIPIAGLRALFFRDPDGTCLELIETPTARA